MGNKLIWLMGAALGLAAFGATANWSARENNSKTTVAQVGQRSRKSAPERSRKSPSPQKKIAF